MTTSTSPQNNGVLPSLPLILYGIFFISWVFVVAIVLNLITENILIVTIDDIPSNSGPTTVGVEESTVRTTFNGETVSDFNNLTDKNIEDIRDSLLGLLQWDNVLPAVLPCCFVVSWLFFCLGGFYFSWFNALSHRFCHVNLDTIMSFVWVCFCGCVLAFAWANDRFAE
jgi:hypothetical protein